MIAGARARSPRVGWTAIGPDDNEAALSVLADHPASGTVGDVARLRAAPVPMVVRLVVKGETEPPLSRRTEEQERKRRSCRRNCSLFFLSLLGVRLSRND